MSWKIVASCFGGPRLYRRFRLDEAQQANIETASSSLYPPSPTSPSPELYKPNFLESNCGFVLSVIGTCCTIVIYLSPILLTSAGLRRSIMGMSPEFALKFALGVSLVYGGMYIGRGLGRMANPDYLRFLGVLRNCLQQRSGMIRTLPLRAYDFDFDYWPVDYEWQATSRRYGEKFRPRRYLPPVSVAYDSRLKQAFMNGLSYVVAHTVARRLAYPGSLSLLQAAIGPAIVQGRQKLVEQLGGRRFKLRTSTGNSIDTMYVDRRNSKDRWPNGNVLVITCEGNGGFYEVGSATTPLEAKYSVLMWNHPGFGGSTGVPWPSEEAAAIDVVMQFAVEALGWEEGDIIFYGWSIGGYTATWAAMNYPNIRGLVLDATFDDVLPLALRTMPSSWAGLVEHTIRSYLNLDIGAQLKQYDGPFYLVRRSRDEIVAMEDADPDAVRRSNRGNYLLKTILAHRYPKLFTEQALLDTWLAASMESRKRMGNDLEIDERQLANELRSYVDERGGSEFPMDIGDDMKEILRYKLGIYIASKHFFEFDSTHCVPLPAENFHIPNHPWSTDV